MRISTNSTYALYAGLNYNNTPKNTTQKTAENTTDKTTKQQSKEISEEQINNSEDTKASTFVNNTEMPDEFVQEIIERAKQGAHNCVYMGEEFHDFINAYKVENISPDRSIIPSVFENMLSVFNNKLPTLFDLLGTSYTASTVPGMATFYENGEAIMIYSQTGGYTPQQTQAEGKYYDETKDIYYQAYTGERARMSQEGIADATGNIPKTSGSGSIRLNLVV